MSQLSRKNHSRNEWHIVHISYSDMEAHIVAGRLKHEGIPCIVERAIGSNAIGISIGQLGEVRVLVHPNDYDAAMDILEPEEPSELLDDTSSPITYHFDEFEDDSDEPE